MLSFDETSKRIYKSIQDGTAFSTHMNLIIVGDNTSGKSTLLKEILIAADNEKKGIVYYIDSLNRVVVDAKDEALDYRYSKYSVIDILSDRIDDGSFSNEDIFCDGVRGGVLTYAELHADVENYEQLLQQFMSCTLKVGKKSTLFNEEETLFFNEVEINKISSSEAAKIRIVLEVNYAVQSGCKTIVIDEFDSHFDNRNLVEFMGKLLEVYSDTRFIFVIHNFELLVRITNMDALVYNNDVTAPLELLWLDCNDISELGQVFKIRSAYIGGRSENELLLSRGITSFVKNGDVEECDKRIILELDRGTLTSRCKVMYDYLIERGLS